MHHKLSHYKCAANLLKQAVETGVNIKNVLFNDKKYTFMNIKSLFALVCEALKQWNIIEILINDSKILDNEPGFNIWHVRILITELIFGKKVIDGENSFVNKILEYESMFRELLSRPDVQKLVACKKNLDAKVRYIKVNSIKETVDSLINVFTEEGWQLLPTADSYQEYLGQLRGLEPHSEFFLQDFHIPDVLVFAPGTELHSHYHYKNGSFFFMDKSSCLAPHLLRPHQDSSVLDMCAAPGLKTIHLAGLVESGKVYAVERDAARFKALKEMVGLCGADNVIPIHEDVTKLKVDDYADVKYILLDPSCSGSGMRERQPLAVEDTASTDKQRLYRLAGFQLTLLRFALTRFPQAKRVVYSTCSLNVEENEEVVEAALNSKYHDFKIASISKKLSGWTNFGSEKFSFGTKCIYCKPESDLTNGFFVAVFKRRKQNISNEGLEPVVNSDDQFSYNVNPNNKHSKMKFSEIDNENMLISSPNANRNTSTKNDLDCSIKYKTSSKASNFDDEGVPSKTTKSKKRVHDNILDTENNCPSPNKMQRKNENILNNKNFTNNGIQKSVNDVKMAVGKKENLKKQITKSKMKRLRQNRKKISELQTNKVKKKKKKKVNKNVLESQCSKINVKHAKVKTGNICNESKYQKEIPLKMSKAKFRNLRTKKLKFKLKNNTKTGIPISSLTHESKEKITNTSNKGKENVPTSLNDSVGHISKHRKTVSSVSKNIKLSSEKVKKDKKQLIANTNDTELILKSEYSNNNTTKETSTVTTGREKSEVSLKRKKKVSFDKDALLTESFNSSNAKLLKEKKRKKKLSEF